MELLGCCEDPICHLNQKGAHSIMETWMGWICPELRLPRVALVPCFPRAGVLNPRLAVGFVTLTRYLIVCHKRLHTSGTDPGFEKGGGGGTPKQRGENWEINYIHDLLN